MVAKDTYTQWHPGFCSAVELTLNDDAEYLSYLHEKTLNTKPLLIDLIVIKKQADKELKNEIGKLFKGNNILEYKSPDDELNLNTFYKAISYACLYKSYESPGNLVRPDSLTVSLVRMRKPMKLFKDLDSFGWKVEKKFQGIYYVYGDTMNIPVQVIVTKELDEDQNLWLKLIQNDVNEQIAKKAIRYWNASKSEHERNLIDSIMQVSMRENEKAYNLVKEDEAMCQALMELMKPEFDAAVDAAVDTAIDAAVKEAVSKNNEDVLKKAVAYFRHLNPSWSDDQALSAAKAMLG